MIFVSVSTINYLHRTEVMAKSIKEFHPDSKVIICLLEKDLHPIAMNIQYTDEIILAKNLGIPNVDQYIFKYTISEASCAFKSEILKYVYKKEPHEQYFIYLDSDTRLYSPISEVQALLYDFPIVLTPHCIKKPKEEYLKFGIFNAGFLGIKRTEEAEQFIKWWAEKVKWNCYIDWDRFLFVDQGWLNLVPTYFNAFILRHPGYNVAFWNFHERKIELDSKKQYTINNQPLRFFHHSQLLNSLKEGVENSKNEVLKNLYDEYIAELKQSRVYHLSNNPWSYDFFDNGEQIKNKSRKEFQNNECLRLFSSNPFNLMNDHFRKKC
ncbi:hypothetical protein LIT38_12975 [Bacillus sp. CMF12]|uniref:hypothetical protein n=1 Tax=Bacillaceae TaxID=186817 RepID=UPI001FB47585|nr:MULTISPECIES: hypothetical protein [Bacillaceae]UOE53091.1 hypothetical protein IRB79_14270 [Cytobacillus oceanisediminis]USK52299.1 hypothetical protein LIT38_12975 [Bacillus sp. CMF12]